MSIYIRNYIILNIEYLNIMGAQRSLGSKFPGCQGFDIDALTESAFSTTTDHTKISRTYQPNTMINDVKTSPSNQTNTQTSILKTQSQSIKCTDDLPFQHQQSQLPTLKEIFDTKLKIVEPQQQNRLKKNISNFKIHCHKMIGSGSSADIFLGFFEDIQHNQKQIMVAIKRINKKKLVKKEQIDRLIIQEEIFRVCNSPFIPKIYGTSDDVKYHYLAMEYASGGNCYELIDKNSEKHKLFKKTGQNGIRFLVGCVILGLEQLHSKGYIYADLKPENVLLFKDGYAKLTDFGISKKLKPEQRTYLASGSHLYLAPQFVGQEKCGMELDLWSLGIFIYELANCTTPFDAETIKYLRSFLRKIKVFEEQRQWHESGVSENLKDLVYRLLKINPEDRLGAKGLKQIKDHSFFKDQCFDWTKMRNKDIRSPLKWVLEDESFNGKSYNHGSRTIRATQDEE